MKIATILAALCLSAVSVFAQGQIAFQNGASAAQQIRIGTYGDGLDATQTARSLMPLNGTTSFSFFVNYGTTSANLNNTTAGTPVFNSTTTLGRLAGSGTGGYALSAAAPGDQVFLQMFGFSTSAGNYATALAQSQVGNSGIYAGNTPIIQTLALTAAPAPGTAIFGSANTANAFSGFTLFTTVPEPTTLALLGLGAASLVVFRRRK